MWTCEELLDLLPKKITSLLTSLISPDRSCSNQFALYGVCQTRMQTPTDTHTHFTLWVVVVCVWAAGGVEEGLLLDSQPSSSLQNSSSFFMNSWSDHFQLPSGCEKERKRFHPLAFLAAVGHSYRHWSTCYEITLLASWLSIQLRQRIGVP